MTVVDEFFREIDRRWNHPTTDRITLNIIGSGALMLQAQYERGTRDSDVLETESLTPPIKDALLALAGRSTKLAAQTGMYLDADAMIKRGLVDHAELVARFQSAFIEFSHDNRAADLERYVANLNRVERDMLNVPETEFDLTMLRY